MPSYKAKRFKSPNNRCNFCGRVSTKLFVSLKRDFKRLGCTNTAALCRSTSGTCHRRTKELDHLAIIEVWFSCRVRSIDWFVARMGLSRGAGVMWAVQEYVQNISAGSAEKPLHPAHNSSRVASSPTWAILYFTDGCMAQAQSVTTV